MPDIDTTVSRIVDAEAWNTRVRLIQQIPEDYGRALLPDVYSRLAQKLYVPQLAPDFAYIHWPERFELSEVETPYEQAYAGTDGNILEDEVERILAEAGIPFTRAGSTNQDEIVDRFNISVRPAPDFVIYDRHGSLRGMLECKLINNGGTARDKAGQWTLLRAEADQLGGPPVFAALAGLGWTRTKDALGPVIRDCDGRVFTLTTLSEMRTVDPLPAIAAQLI